MAIRGSCHCGAVQFEAPEPTEFTSCNCSYCERVGALWAYCTPDRFRLLSVPERLSNYRFGSYVAVHHPCAVCGCATHGGAFEFSGGKPDFQQPIIGYNMRMAPDFDRSEVKVREVDGRSF